LYVYVYVTLLSVLGSIIDHTLCIAVSIVWAFGIVLQLHVWSADGDGVQDWLKGGRRIVIHIY